MFRVFLTLLLLALFMFPASAKADAGLPMIFPVMNNMFWALIPVILAEAFLLRKSLKVNFKEALSSSGIANAVSTFLGIPLTWIVLVVFSATTGGGGAYGLDSCFTKILAVTWQAPWLIPYEPDEMKWMFPMARLVLLLPFFLASWAIEYRVLRKMHREINKAELNIACLKANALTYFFLLLYAISQLDISGFTNLKRL